jgi:hydroxymethylbilane synthase
MGTNHRSREEPIHYTARTVIVGTRGSALAVRQTELIVTLLRQRHPEILFMVTTLSTVGDQVPDRPISAIGDKGIFVRSIERALLDGAIDVAVHSLKDVPADLETPGLVLAAFGARTDPRDVLIASHGTSLATLPSESRIGTSSLRRRVQLRVLRSDLGAVDIRGNVDTRLRKLDAGEYDAIVLAAAGLHRLGLQGRITQYLPVELMVPDAGQGILAVQVRRDDPVIDIVQAADDPESRIAALAERAVVRALGADCHSPVGAVARIDGASLHLEGMAATPDGSQLHRLARDGSVHDAEAMGSELGKDLRSLLLY